LGPPPKRGTKIAKPFLQVGQKDQRDQEIRKMMMVGAFLAADLFG
jgi:hypothetical protein